MKWVWFPLERQFSTDSSFAFFHTTLFGTCHFIHAEFIESSHQLLYQYTVFFVSHSYTLGTHCYVYIYIYAFSGRFYPKRLTLHSSYSFTFYQLLLSLGIEPMILALLAPCSTFWATGKLALHIGIAYCYCTRILAASAGFQLITVKGQEQRRDRERFSWFCARMNLPDVFHHKTGVHGW